MTKKKIIDGLKYTIDMFLFNPSDGSVLKEPRNEQDKITVETCREAIKALSEPTIPLSVIEDIKAEIEKAYKHQRIVQGTEWTNGLLCSVEIIDRKIAEVKDE